MRVAGKNKLKPGVGEHRRLTAVASHILAAEKRVNGGRRQNRVMLHSDDKIPVFGSRAQLLLNPKGVFLVKFL